jgi:hypothetical protein
VQVGTLAISITVPSGEALRNMSRRDWEDIATDKIIPALDALDRKGVRQAGLQRYDR